MTELLTIDGSHGEGGGQILRTAVTLSALTGRPIRIGNIRAGRPRPGLAAQHLTAIRAVAKLCHARINGDALGSQQIDFIPGARAVAGHYRFDVATAREGGSAGSACLVLQTLVPPLALAPGKSRLSIRGGTHMAWSPSFDYIRDVWLPAIRQTGISASAALRAWGWYPIGQGEIDVEVSGLDPGRRCPVKPLNLVERGRLRTISGRGVAANLPSQIAERMVARAEALLSDMGAEMRIEPIRVGAACAGAGLFLTAEYEHVHCGFTALGKRGKPAEQVADEAAGSLKEHWRSGEALDRHLADQILVPLTLASGLSRFSTERISRHLRTNAWVVERFGLARVDFDCRKEDGGLVTVVPEAAVIKALVPHLHR